LKKGIAFVKPSLKEKFESQVNITIGIKSYVDIPGVTQDQSSIGTELEIKFSKISLSKAKLFTKIIESDDIYETAFSLEFLFRD
jgi:hypothetical protein